MDERPHRRRQTNYDLPEATRRANRRCSNKRLHALGYQFKYPNYKVGYDALLTEIGLV